MCLNSEFTVRGYEAFKFAAATTFVEQSTFVVIATRQSRVTTRIKNTAEERSGMSRDSSKFSKSLWKQPGWTVAVSIHIVRHAVI